MLREAKSRSGDLLKKGAAVVLSVQALEFSVFERDGVRGDEFVGSGSYGR